MHKPLFCAVLATVSALPASASEIPAFASKVQNVIVFGLGDYEAVKARLAKWGQYEPVEVVPGKAQIGFFFAKLTDTPNGGLMFSDVITARKPGVADPKEFQIWDTLFDNAALSRAWAKAGKYEYSTADIHFDYGTDLSPKSFSVTQDGCELLNFKVGQPDQDDSHALVVPADFESHTVSPEGDLTRFTFKGKQYIRDFVPGVDQIDFADCSPLKAEYEAMHFIPLKTSLVGTVGTDGPLQMNVYERSGNIKH